MQTPEVKEQIGEAEVMLPPVDVEMTSVGTGEEYVDTLLPYCEVRRKRERQVSACK